MRRHPPGASRTAPAPVAGALYMLAASFGFALMNLIIRLAAADLHPIEIAFFRNVFALVFMLPWFVRVGPSALHTRRPRMHVVRAIVGIGSMFLWFTSVARLPMADAVALNFTAPLFATIGAALFLGETVRARRWTATAIGFLGSLVILRPGFATITLTTLLPIFAAVFMAGSSLVVKSLSRTEAPGTVVLYMNLLLTALSLPPALLVWRTPAPGTLLLLVGLGALASTSHIMLTRAYARADASAIQPLDYARLPFVAVLGYLFFGEVPGGALWAGAAIIAAAAVYIAHREAHLARATAPPRLSPERPTR